MSKKDDLFDFFNKNINIVRKEAIEQAMNKFNVTETTAVTYYADWRRDFMNVAPTTKKQLEKEVEEDKLKYTAKKNIESDKVVQSNTEVKKKKIQLIPIMFKGPVFTYQINKDGVKIVDGESDIVTEEIVLEQQAAIEKYKEIYGGSR